jgi:hypothetical protein
VIPWKKYKSIQKYLNFVINGKFGKMSILLQKRDVFLNGVFCRPQTSVHYGLKHHQQIIFSKSILYPHVHTEHKTVKAVGKAIIDRIRVVKRWNKTAKTT